MLSKNPRVLAVFELIGHLAHSSSPVLIEGESGTGKQVLARAIHDAGPARTGPLVVVNCAALPESLLEGQLFGQEQETAGRRPGAFEAARGGTLYLNRVYRLPLSVQSRLADEEAERNA